MADFPLHGYPHSGGFMYFPVQYGQENIMIVNPTIVRNRITHCDFAFRGSVDTGFVPVKCSEIVKILEKFNRQYDPEFSFSKQYDSDLSYRKYSGNNIWKFILEKSNISVGDNFFKYLESTGNGRLCVFTNMKDKPYVNARFVNRVTGEVVIPQSGEYTDPGNFMGSHLTYEKDSNGKIVGSHSDWSFEYDYQLDKEGRIIADNTKPRKAGIEDLIYTKFVK